MLYVQVDLLRSHTMDDTENTAGPRIEAVVAELEDEHVRIMGLVDELRGHRTLIDLVPLLEQLHSVLINHFAREQFPGGLYECLGAYGSEHDEDLRVLVKEHCLILSAVRGLLERARAAPEEQSSEILGDANEVVESLYKHEQREHELAEKLLRERA
jgi:hypothetical protein